MSKLPAAAGTLAIDFMTDFHLEKSIHCTDEYVSLLRDLRANVSANTVCCFCGFPDKHFLEAHHVDGNHSNNEPENLRYICTLCHRLQHLGWCGVSNLGKIIYIPTMIDHKKTRFWLEPFQHVQRFYLMSNFLSSDEQKRLKTMPFSNNISQLISSLKTQDIDARYLDQREERAKYLNDIKKIEQAGDATKKAEVIEAVKLDRADRAAKLEDTQAGSDFSDLHILDLLSILVDSGKKDVFLQQQADGTQGRMAILFNRSVFEPFEPNPDYALEDRLNYYREIDYFSASGLQTVMHTLRKQEMENNNGY